MSAPISGVATELGSRPGSFESCSVPVDLAAIVVTYNNATDIQTLISSLRAATVDCRIRLIVIDNGSSDGTLELVRQHPDVTLIAAEANPGYAAGINMGRGLARDAGALLILNPDVVVQPGAIGRLRERLREPGVGAVVTTLLDSDGIVYPSLRREPSTFATFADALLGRKLTARPAWSSETCCDPETYRQQPHRIDWATGAAILIGALTDIRVGEWDETFFLYSEETDYFRRVRAAGSEVWYEPAANVTHRGGGSGSAPALTALLAVNRIRYVAKTQTKLYTAGFAAAAALTEAIRVWDKGHRLGLKSVIEFGIWRQMPSYLPGQVDVGSVRPTAHGIAGSSPEIGLHGGDATGHDERLSQLGSVVIPAHNEFAVIERTLRPLAPLARSGALELIVVANGCTDSTAAAARAISGTKVIETNIPSKTAALNLGDQTATRWPRFYLDADIEVPIAALVATSRALAEHGLLAARPTCRYDLTGTTSLVRSFYRARASMPSMSAALWGAGIYALSQQGHRRLQSFPDLSGDDLWVDQLFEPAEKRVIESPPVVVRAPRKIGGLIAILRRTQHGNAQVRARSGSSSTRNTMREIVIGVRGPRSLFDATVYAAVVVLARLQVRIGSAGRWDRDESSRQASPQAMSSEAPAAATGEL